MQSLITAHVAQHFLKLDIDGDCSFRIDQEGRWCSYRTGDQFFRRTLSDQIIFQHRPLPGNQALKLHEDIRQRLQRIYRRFKSANKGLNLTGSHTSAQEFLLRSQAWNLLKLQANAVLFDQAYPEVVAILPPDRYQDVVVLPATGCPHAKCSFCAFYQGSSFQVLSLSEFEQHLAAVKTLFGETLSAREGFFLGSANALALPQRKLSAMLALLEQEFGARKRGIASFFDPEHAPTRELKQWQELAALGLRQIVIGLETGLPELRKTWGKSKQLNPIKHAIELAKQAGITVGLTVLVETGNQDLERAHREATTQFIAQLDLMRSDQVYLSPLQLTTTPGTDLSPGTTDTTEKAHLSNELKNLFREATKAKVIHYGMDKFYYFA